MPDVALSAEQINRFKHVVEIMCQLTHTHKYHLAHRPTFTREYHLRNDLGAAELALPRVRAAMQEVSDRRNEKLSAYRGEALQKLSAARVELASLSEASRSNEDKVNRTTVRAPATGIVKTVHVTTAGQVVQPGFSLAEIVPMNDSLLIEAQIRPQDIAFVRPGQEALVKITAYDFSIYGGLKARVEQRSGRSEARALALTAAILDEIALASAGAGARPVFAYLPVEHEMEQRALTPTPRQRFFLDYCANRRVVCLDLRQAFFGRASSDAAPSISGHWNAAEHRLAAEALRDGLAREGLLPRPASSSPRAS